MRVCFLTSLCCCLSSSKATINTDPYSNPVISIRHLPCIYGAVLGSACASRRYNKWYCCSKTKSLPIYQSVYLSHPLLGQVKWWSSVSIKAHKGSTETWVATYRQPGVTSGKAQISFQNTPHRTVWPTTSSTTVLLALGKVGMVGAILDTSKWETEKGSDLPWVGRAEVWIHLRVSNLWGRGPPRWLGVKGKTSWKEWGKPTFYVCITCYPTLPMSLCLHPLFCRREEEYNSAPRGIAHQKFLRSYLRICSRWQRLARGMHHLFGS